MCRITDELKKRIWNKALKVEGYDPEKVRKDSCGAWIVYDRYNDKSSIFGWEIDHIYPLKGLLKRNTPEEIRDNILNLRPLNWLNNQSKSYDYPIFHAVVTAKDDHNVRGDYQFEIDKTLQNELDSLFGSFL